MKYEKCGSQYSLNILQSLHKRTKGKNYQQLSFQLNSPYLADFVPPRSTEHIPVKLLQRALSGIIRRAEEIGMKANCKKTFMVCQTPDNGYRPSTSLAAGQDTIGNSDSVKLLGCTINSAPGASGQVEAILNKFRVRYWSLIHLRSAGIKGSRLFRLYAALVRPFIENNNVIYHSMLTRTQTKAIEKLQRHLFGLCSGHQVRYAETLASNNQDTLETRRIKACKKLASKTIQQGG